MFSSTIQTCGGGALATRLLREPTVPWVAFRIHYDNLFTLIEGSRNRFTAELSGSVPPECAALWPYAENAFRLAEFLTNVSGARLTGKFFENSLVRGVSPGSPVVAV